MAEIANLKIYDKLPVDKMPNHNYENFSTLLQTAKSKHILKCSKNSTSVDIKKKGG